MDQNDERNARKCHSEYARPFLERPISLIHSPLNKGANFVIDSHVMSMLPIFYNKPSLEPYRHVDKLSQVCKINQIHNVPVDVMKMKLFLTTLRE